MLYQIKRQGSSQEAPFIVQDEQNRVILLTDHVLMRHEPLILKNGAGEKYACILENMSALRATFDIYKHHHVSASIKRTALPLLRERYLITLMDGTTLTTQGNVTLYRYRVRRGNRAVATITPAAGAEEQGYQVSILPDEDALLLLAVMIVIDMLAHAD
ncbi:MAG TPA: hypothetical protein VL485_04945 [Ktedonobacteraceae bacterium]|jgi:uncharacterized protein YxjI|nr:hypothetical protein [Ktedonobacteraceae bacterium]